MNLELQKSVFRWTRFAGMVMVLSISAQWAIGQASSPAGVSSPTISPASAPHPSNAPAAVAAPPSMDVSGSTSTVSSSPILVERGPRWDKAENQWTGKDTLGTLSVVAALSALLFSAYTRWKTGNQTYYAHLSRVWYDLRKEEGKNPGWMDPSETSMYGLTDPMAPSVHTPTAYDAHAWTCWALAEDVYETYAKSWRSPHSGDSNATNALFRNELSQFIGSIQSVTELHWAWLQRPEHQARFSDEFVKWIDSDFLRIRVAEMTKGAISGTGLMATTAIKSGQFLGFLAGTVQPVRGPHTLQMGEGIHLLLDKPMRFLNHQPTPDANAVVRGRGLFACSDISPWTEITIDYACTEYEFSLDATGPKLGYASLTKDERARRGDRIHVWLLKRDAPGKSPMPAFEVPV